MRVIKTSELTLCVLDNFPIEIHCMGDVRLCERIISYNEKSICIKDGFYLRHNCELYIHKIKRVVQN